MPVKMESKQWQKFKKDCPSKCCTLGEEIICGAKAIDEFPSDRQFCKYQKNCPLVYMLEFSGKG